MFSFGQTSDQSKYKASGFAILYSVVVIALATGLAAVLTSSASRQTQLVTTSSQSTQALTAASTGLECAMYWDLHEDAFSASNPNKTTQIDCAETDNITVKNNGTGSENGQTYHKRYFEIKRNDAAKCLYVQVRKYEKTGNKPAKTAITAYGYDDCSNREVERKLKTSY